jgi:hypothetical protein
VTYLNRDYIQFLQDKDPSDWREDKDFVELVSNLAIAMYNVGTEVRNKLKKFFWAYTVVTPIRELIFII